MKTLLLITLTALALTTVRANPPEIPGSWYDNFAPTGSWSVKSYATAEAPNGDLWLATSATDRNNTVPVARLQRFDGRQWYDEDPGVNDRITQMAIDSEGRLYIAGRFTEIDGQSYNHIAVFDGDSWQSLQSGLQNSTSSSVSVQSLYLDEEENLWVGGSFDQAGTTNTHNLAKWNGSTWEGFGTYIDHRVSVRRMEQVVDTMYVFTARNSSYEKHKGLLRYALKEQEWAPSALHGLDVGLIYASRFDGDKRLYLGTQALANPAGFLFGYYDFDKMALVAIPGIDGNNPSVNHIGRDHAGNIYLSGYFEGAEGNESAHILRYHPEDGWGGFGSGIQGYYNPNNPTQHLSLGLDHMLVNPDGSFYVTGDVGLADERHVYNIAYWNGTEWDPLGKGLSGNYIAYSAKGYATSLSLDQQGKLLVGSSQIFGGQRNKYTARWNSEEEAWEALGGGLGSEVLQLIEAPDGTLYAGGSFRNVTQNDESIAFNRIARFNGSDWEPMADGFPGTIHALYADEELLLAGGNFNKGDGVRTLASWNQEEERWESMGGFGGTVHVIKKGPDGRIYIGGSFNFSEGEESISHIAAWDGTRYYPLGNNGVANIVYDLAFLPNGELVAAGSFSNTGDNGRLNRIALLKADGQWHPMGEGFNRTVDALAVTEEGALIAAGEFETSGDRALAYLAAWNGSEWLGFENGPDGPVRHLALDDSGTLWMGGRFFNAGGLKAQGLTHWTGSIEMVQPNEEEDPGEGEDPDEEEDLPVGLNDPESASTASYQVHPNPVQDALHISADNTNGKHSSYMLRSLSAAPLQQGALNAETTIVPVGPLAPGVYLLQLQGESGLETHKIIKR